MAKLSEDKGPMENFGGGDDIKGMQTASPSETDPPTRSDTEARIIAAARELFLEHGYSGVSGDRLCKAARVSKTSLYKYFGDMNGVFEAVVLDEGDVFDMSIGDMPETKSESYDALVDYGDRLLNLLNRGFCIRLDRMIHEEARSNPQLAKTFYEAAYGRGHREVERLIAHGQAKGFFTRPEPATDLADNLISRWAGLRFIRARLGLSNHPFDAPREWSKQCVKTLFGPEAGRNSGSELGAS